MGFFLRILTRRSFCKLGIVLYEKIVGVFYNTTCYSNDILEYLARLSLVNNEITFRLWGKS